MLKLYVWEDFCTDWTPGLAFAIANSEEEAIQIVREKLKYSSEQETFWRPPDIYNLDSSIGFAVMGGG
jgi:hypothetical protein